MPRDSGGIYSLPAGYTAVSGETILPSQHNPPLEDIAAALTASLPRNGAAPMTGNLAMGGNKAIGLAPGTNPADAVRFDQLNAPRADIASATTTDIGAESTQYLRVTGTTTITGLGTAAAGVVRDLLFADALTLTHNATSLINLSGDDITTAAGDVALFRSEGSGNWRMVRYSRADGTSLVGSVDGTTTITRTGGTNSTLLVSAIAKAWAIVGYGGGTPSTANSFNISSLTDNGTGDLSYNYTSAFSSVNFSFEATGGLNSAGTQYNYASQQNRTASSARFVFIHGSPGTLNDLQSTSHSAHGDLA